MQATTLTYLVLVGIASVSGNGARHKRVFSLFNVVTFKNGPCTSTTDSATKGTCLSNSDCVRQSGSTDGNCASGFGVCCVFAITGCNGDVKQNCTYIRNAGYPSADRTVSQSCAYNLKRINPDLCQIRLDFENVQLTLDSAIIGGCGGTGDSLKVSSPLASSAAAFPPVVCGTLTGQHMYFDTGDTSDAGKLEIMTGTNMGDRKYNIKVSFIECNSPSRPPTGCAQYFTGPTGTVSSYNFGGSQLLSSQFYTNCIRQAEGYCQATFKESASATGDAFQLTNVGTTADVLNPTVMIPNPDSTASGCMDSNHISIPSTVEYIVGKAAPSFAEIDHIPSQRCGQVFGSLADAQSFTEPSSLTTLRGVPIEVRVLSREQPQVGLVGFSLDYIQVPC